MLADTNIPLFGGDALDQLSPAVVVESLEHALLEGLNIEADSPRMFSPLRAGEFLLMPSETAIHAGIKVVTIAPENGTRGLPRIHAWYLLFDAITLQPVAIVEGAGLTLVRTAAVTSLAIRHLLAATTDGARDRVHHLAVIGSGPQADAHVRTLSALIPVERVTIIGRTPDRVSERVHSLSDLSCTIESGEHSTLPSADVIITVTSSTKPVLTRADVADDAVVAAVGSHGEASRELASDLILDSDIVVEARASALRENGNLLLARTSKEWMEASPQLANLADLTTGRFTRRADRPAVYTGVGMSWEDLVVVGQLIAQARDAG